LIRGNTNHRPTDRQKKSILPVVDIPPILMGRPVDFHRNFPREQREIEAVPSRSLALFVPGLHHHLARETQWLEDLPSFSL
jgi:hypothetical protein